MQFFERIELFPKNNNLFLQNKFYDNFVIVFAI